MQIGYLNRFTLINSNQFPKRTKLNDYIMPKNKFITGFIIAALLPIIGFYFWQFVIETLGNSASGKGMGLTPTWRIRTVYLLAICTNLIPFQIFSKRKEINSMRGVSLPTIIYVFIWVYYFRYILFG